LLVPFFRRCRSRRFNYLETKCAYYFSTLHCNKNIPAILPATTTVAGIITLATQAEVNAGVDANKAVTPVTLQAKLNLSGSQTVTRNEFAIIGDAAATSFVINHGLNTRAVLVSIQKRCSIR
jgi:hypothetical protein